MKPDLIPTHITRADLDRIDSGDGVFVRRYHWLYDGNVTQWVRGDCPLLDGW
jgi:hypothetical protein